jgi:L-rhamnose mutarotase
MIRKAFVMEVLPGKIKGYEKSHNPIWPELQDLFDKQGVHNYSIFFHETTNQLFGYVEIEDEARWNAIAKTAICQKWWKHMTNFMVTTDAEGFPKPKDAALREVFHIN